MNTGIIKTKEIVNGLNVYSIKHDQGLDWYYGKIELSLGDFVEFNWYESLAFKMIDNVRKIK